jgi:hypothetical protein
VQYRCATSFGRSTKLGEENAVFGMSILQVIVIWELIYGTALLTGRPRIVIPTFAAVLGYFFLLLFPYFVLVRTHQWLVYKSEFEHYSRRKHFLASLSVGILMAALIAGLGVIKHAITAAHSV